MADPSTPRHPDLPECGWYRIRLVRGGPFVPARIVVDRDIDPDTGELTAPEILRCEVAGQPADPMRHWLYLDPVSKSAFDTLTASLAAGRDPHKRLNLMKEVAGPNG